MKERDIKRFSLNFYANGSKKLEVTIGQIEFGFEQIGSSQFDFLKKN
jgi:hypothetical protein